MLLNIIMYDEGCIIKSLGSEDKTEVENACKKADNLLMKMDSDNVKKCEIKSSNGCIPCEDTDKTKIDNDKSIDPKEASMHTKVKTESNTMSKGAFLAYVSKDASRRFADKKSRKAKSHALKKEANIAFRSGDYIKALDLYNKAINEVRDSCVLYTNRALTFLQLGFNSKALDDCKLALRLSPSSLKALVYKARAHRAMGQIDLSDSCMQEALNHHPQHSECIKYAVEKHDLKAK